MLPPKSLIAMIAVPALPGAPLYEGSKQKIIDQVASDLEHYKAAGVDSLMLENDFDVPYMKEPMNGEALEIFTDCCKLVRENFNGPIGIQILEAQNVLAMETAHKTQLDFIRAEAYVFALVGSSGIIDGSAGAIQRRKKELEADVLVFADVKKKHCSHAITADLDITEELRQAELFLVDGVIVTGVRTKDKPKIDDLKKVKEISSGPVLIGSGMTPENIENYLPYADGFIVGSTFRKNGEYLAELDPDRLSKFVDTFNSIKNS